MRPIRNILLRKSRSMLTISGVGVGILAMVVLGALAERESTMVEAGSRFRANRVVVTEERNTATFGTTAPLRFLSTDIADKIYKVSGVREVIPQVMLALDPVESVTIGEPRTMAGGFMGSDMRNIWRFTDGRGFSEKDRGVAVIGSDLVSRFDATVGKMITLRGRKFRVVGILDTTLNGLDASVFVPLADAQAMYHESLPESFQEMLKVEELAVAFTVYPEPGQDPDALAKRINKEVRGVVASGPTAWTEQVTGLASMLHALAFAVGAIALIAGCLLVMNTMMMAVSERTREVGIERAMGASTGRIVREFVAESAVLGAAGGVIGLLPGTLAVALINAVTIPSGIILFAVTPRLAVGAVVFSIALGTAAGIYPAWHASRLNPVEALAYE